MATKQMIRKLFASRFNTSQEAAVEAEEVAEDVGDPLSGVCKAYARFHARITISELAIVGTFLNSVFKSLRCSKIIFLDGWQVAQTMYR